MITSELSEKVDLASLKSKVDADIDKLVTVPSDLSKSSNAVDKCVVKEAVIDKDIQWFRRNCQCYWYYGAYQWIGF